MTALWALVYADWRAARNDLRRVLHSPRRIVLWLFYAAVLGLFVVSRVVSGGRAGAAARPVGPSTDYFVCALLVTLVFSLAAGRGAVGIFRSQVEARFIIGSPIAAPLAIAYLQSREVLGQGFRYLFSLFYVLFVFGPQQIGLVAAGIDVALVIGVFAASAAIVVPRRLLPPRAGRACVIAGIPLGLLALAPAVRNAVVQLHVPAALAGPVLAFIPAWHPGRILLEPNVLWLLAVVVLAAAGIATLATAGRDAYPELFALSLARIERRERLRRRRAGVPGSWVANPARRFALPAPRGVLVFVWKSAVEFRRVASPPYVVAGAVAWFGAGFAAARRLAGDDGTVFGALGVVLINLILIVGIGATISLAGELRRPLFWLSPAAFFERLCALGFAQIWRTVFTLEIIAAGFASGGGSAAQTLLFALGLPALVALIAGAGFAAFALFPSAADQRAPVAALRSVFGALLIVPPLVLDGVGAGVFHAPLVALVSASLLALIEAGALVGVAAWRLDGNLDRLQT